MTNEQISQLTIRGINKYFRGIDESNKFPINGKFNVTERAIRKLRRMKKNGLEVADNLTYYYYLEQIISDIVNNEKNW